MSDPYRGIGRRARRFFCPPELIRRDRHRIARRFQEAPHPKPAPSEPPFPPESAGQPRAPDRGGPLEIAVAVEPPILVVSNRSSSFPSQLRTAHMDHSAPA